MNVNEVIANRGNELMGSIIGANAPLHPNDHVNMCQSSNDCFPTAIRIAAVREIDALLIPALAHLRDALADRQAAFDPIVKIGRTHLQDAVPLTLGQEFSGYRAQVEHALARIREAVAHLYPVAQGGTAVGTGLNAPPRFAELFAGLLAAATSCPSSAHPTSLRRWRPMMRGLVHGALAAAATGAVQDRKRHPPAGSARAAAGRASAAGERAGSSIMPGKVNPTQCEALTMVCCVVFGNQTTVTMAASQGHLELNVFKPVIAQALLQSIRLLADATRSFTDHCVAGIGANTARIEELMEKSLMLVTALAPRLGYDNAARIAKAAHATGTTLREEAIRLELLAEDEFDALVRPERWWVRQEAEYDSNAVCTLRIVLARHSYPYVRGRLKR
jgi:fumarate hydratase class II